MALDRNAFIDNFIEEFKDNIEKINSGILRLKKDPENVEELNSVLRALHTIKGSSRMLKFREIEKIAHGLENVFKGIKEQRYGISKLIIQLVFTTTDYLDAGAKMIKNDKSDEALEIEKLLNIYEKAYANEPFSLDAVQLQKDAALPGSKAPALPGEGKAEGAGKAAAEKNELPEQESIRVKISQVDKIVKSLNNLIIRQFQFKKENDVLSELEQNFRELAEYNMSTSGSASAEYNKKYSDCLKLIQQIRKNFSEELPLLERGTFEVQEEILSLRMLPLELILGSLGKMIEETALQINKEIELSMVGTDILIDKVILEKLNDPIIHIVRNAIDHGLEDPDTREKAGKPRTGSIRIKCTSESGNIIISIKDDGRGIDYNRLREKAIEMNPQKEDEITNMGKASLNTFLFQSGFSTKEKITDLSGRGVGLDIVRYNVEQIKGKVTLNSDVEVGSEFILALPLSLATVEGFFLTAGGEKFLIPTNFVKELLIIKEEDKLDLLNKKAIKLRDKIIPIYHLSDILDRDETEGLQKYFVIVVESLGEMIGIIVESVIQYASLVYKPLPSSLNKLKIIQGIVFDESFNIVNILFVPEVITRFKRIRSIDSRKRFSSGNRDYKKVLVVDDSLSTREIEKSILQAENYSVDTAVDGIEALEKTKAQYYHLIITDIQMPRMDGYTFVENLRKNEKYSQTPIIVVSSLDTAEVKERFIKLGASSFIVKSDFERGNLMDEVKKLIG
ncbi:MAG: response regulator [Spirochaetales bacterium]|nr:response regulator [Spirochaetales bacterium]